jgi:hypothetical protein
MIYTWLVDQDTVQTGSQRDLSVEVGGGDFVVDVLVDDDEGQHVWNSVEVTVTGSASPCPPPPGG